MRARKHIDWQEEIRKTERIRSRGLKISIISLLVAVAAIGGANLYTGRPLIGGIALKIILLFFFFLIFSALIVNWMKRG